MPNPFLGEIRPVGFNYPPEGWLECNGQLLSVSDHQTLFSLLGTTYGGDGQQTFALPDLRSRIPLHVGNDGFGNSYPIGKNTGVERVTLNVNQIAPHGHPFGSSLGAATTAAPVNGSYLASNPNQPVYTTDVASLVPLAGNAIAVSGGSDQPHDNIMPYLSVNFIICVDGIYPAQA